MKKSLIILGLTALIGAKSHAMLPGAYHPNPAMTLMMMGAFDSHNKKSEGRLEQELNEIVKFRKTVIQPFVEGKDAQEIATTLLNIPLEELNSLVKKTNKILRVSISLSDSTSELTVEQRAVFKRENAVLDTWANVLVQAYEERL